MLPVLLLTASALLSGRRAVEAEALKAPAFDKVLTMLQNLVSQIESEESADERDYSAFMSWFERQHASTSAAIASLGTKLNTLAATGGELKSQQSALSTQVMEQTAEVDREQGQLDDAKDKRASEHDAFVKEQLDFDNAIAGCTRAVEILSAHYGDGKPRENTKPAWMSLVGIIRTIRTSAHRRGRKIPAALSALEVHASGPDYFNAQGTSLFNEYQDKTGEALNIVDQVKLLAQTFQEDKDSSTEQENQLQGAFETLMGQKSSLIASLTKERDAQQSVLNGLNQQVSENDNAMSTAQTTLGSEQAYLAQTEQSEQDTSGVYSKRKEDRAAEKKAISEAVKVLQAENPQLLQIRRAQKHRNKVRALLQLDPECKTCAKASMLLKMKAAALHSELLATAAAEAGTGDVLSTVISQLSGLVTRLDQEQAQETSHKAWCEKELADSNAKKTRHETLVSELEKTITEVEGTIGEKEDALRENEDKVDETDRKFTDLKDLREKAAADYEAELEDYNDAIDALNQAVDMLADFYRDQALLQVQQPVKKLTLAQQHAKGWQDPDASAKEAAPSTAGGYEMKGGLNVVTSLKETRQEFESGKADLTATETKAVSDFATAKTSYEGARQALVEGGNRLTVELQTSQNELAMAKENLQNNQNEVTATTDYLQHVGSSCQSLLDHFDDRSQLRAQEKQAIQDAVQVLEQV